MGSNSLQPACSDPQTCAAGLSVHCVNPVLPPQGMFMISSSMSSTIEAQSLSLRSKARCQLGCLRS